MASALSSLGRFFGGGAGGVAKRLGSAAGRGISSFAGGATRGAASTGSALGRGIAGLSSGAVGRSFGGLGTASGRGALPRVVRGTGGTAPQASPFGGRTRAGGQFGALTPSLLPPQRSGLGSGLSGTSTGGPIGTSIWDMQDRNWLEIQRQQAYQGGDASGLVKEFNRATASAREANESRYQELLRLNEEVSGQQAKDTAADFTRRQANEMQRLTGLGLSGTSGAGVISQGFGRKQSEALATLADKRRRGRGDIIEGRQDIPPSLASLVGLAQLGPSIRGLSGLKFS